MHRLAVEPDIQRGRGERMLSRVRKPLWGRARGATCLVITISLVICAAASAAPGPAQHASATAGRQHLSRAEWLRAVATHRHELANLVAARSRALHRRHALLAAAAVPFQRGDVFL